jgi:hypothetical protein
MATTYTLIDKSILGSSQASLTFSSIPNTYTDLLVLLSLRSSQGSVVDTPKMRFNGATDDSNLKTIRLMGNGSSASSSTVTTALLLTRCPGASATANTFGNIQVYIPNYNSSNNKSVSIDQVSPSNDSSVDGVTSLMAGLFTTSSAISSLTVLSDNAANFVSGSSFYLYGIKNS